ncbi:tol-pal system protein YbgF [Halorhodospira halochloris]|uniref:tol-pal system protein YbgF n=1 Tax=Halorhodospira halochloris TaxID=1052 RepID=UPI001EE8D267|nr:tol-pal system protein YbgF [Halorhodospira halochloris]
MLSANRFIFAAGLALTLVLPAGLSADEREQLEQRLEQLEDKLEGRGFSEVIRDLERIKQENRELRGDIEQLNHQLRRLEQRQHSLYEDLDDRIAELHRRPTREDKEAAPRHTPLASLEEDLHLNDDDEHPEQVGDESELYQQAFEKLSDGLFEQARDDFALVLEHFPEGRYAANALYWIAETYYAENDFEVAADYFEQILDDYAESDKAPDALLKLGYIAFEEDELEKAMAKLEQVRDEHPETTAAELAQQRISDIRRLMPEEDR